MKIYQTKWWTKMFKKEEKIIKQDLLNNIQSIVEFLEDVHLEVKAIKPLLKELEELEKEREVASKSKKIVKINLETQAEVIDKLLDKYEFFQDDADINGIRVKRIADEFLRNAGKEGLGDLVKAKKKDLKWRGW